MNRNLALLIVAGGIAVAAIIAVFFGAATPLQRLAANGSAATSHSLSHGSNDGPSATHDVTNVTGTAAQSKVSPPQPPALPAKDAPFIIKRILPIDGPIRYGDWHWDEAGAPKGPIIITVDLDARVLSVFRDGYEIGTTAVLLGSDNKPTPLGIFPITQKDRHHVSNIYTGAPMPYMQRLTNDGITLHGSNVRRGYVSHGCVGMPIPFAAKLFAITHLGDKVYITRGKYVGVGADLKGN